MPQQQTLPIRSQKVPNRKDWKVFNARLTKKQQCICSPRLLQRSKWIVLLSRVCGTAQHGRSKVLESILSVEVVYEFPSLGLDEQLASLQEVLPAFLDRRLRHIRRVFGVTLPLLKKSPSPRHHSGSNSDNNHCQHRHVEI